MSRLCLGLNLTVCRRRRITLWLVLGATRRRPMRLFWCLALLLGLLSCSRMTTSSNYDDSVNFAALTSFAWMEPPPPRKLNAYQALAEQWIHEAVEEVLVGKGFRKTPSDASDFLVLYATSLKEKREVTRDWDTYFYRYRGMLQSRTIDMIHIRDYDEGMLSIGMVDPRRQRLIWYGGATTEVGSPKHDQETIRKAVSKILAAFPPSPPPVAPLGSSEP